MNQLIFSFPSKTRAQRCEKRNRMGEPDSKKSKVEDGEAPVPAKKAIITGITGQDGSYLAEFLLEKVGIEMIMSGFVNVV